MTKKKKSRKTRGEGEEDGESRPSQKKRKRKQLLQEDLESLPPEQGVFNVFMVLSEQTTDVKM